MPVYPINQSVYHIEVAGLYGIVRVFKLVLDVLDLQGDEVG